MSTGTPNRFARGSDRFGASMGALLGPEIPTDIALAVSGGGDSMAMLALAHHWARHMGVRLWVVTVDHGRRCRCRRIRVEEVDRIVEAVQMLFFSNAFFHLITTTVFGEYSPGTGFPIVPSELSGHFG